jgi:hypothetical protein
VVDDEGDSDTRCHHTQPADIVAPPGAAAGGGERTDRERPELGTRRKIFEKFEIAHEIIIDEPAAVRQAAFPDRVIGNAYDAACPR